QRGLHASASRWDLDRDHVLCGPLLGHAEAAWHGADGARHRIWKLRERSVWSLDRGIGRRSAALSGASAVLAARTRAHRRYLNGPGRPPISGFGFVSAALRCSSTHVRSAPVLAKASPKPELDGRRPRLRFRGWTRATALATVWVCAAGAPFAGRGALGTGATERLGTATEGGHQ